MFKIHLGNFAEFHLEKFAEIYLEKFTEMGFGGGVFWGEGAGTHQEMVGNCKNREYLNEEVNKVEATQELPSCSISTNALL